MIPEQLSIDIWNDIYGYTKLYLWIYMSQANRYLKTQLTDIWDERDRYLKRTRQISETKRDQISKIRYLHVTDFPKRLRLFIRFMNKQLALVISFLSVFLLRIYNTYTDRKHLQNYVLSFVHKTKNRNKVIK